MLLPARLPSIVLAVAATAAAQTYVVDATGAGNFVDIAAAVSAVPSGSTLLVRAGTYGTFQVSAKSLKILCDPGAVVSGPSSASITVSGITAQQSVVVQGLRLVPGSGATFVTCTSCQGSVLLDRLTLANSLGALITATACEQLILRDLDLPLGFQTCTLTDCHTVLEYVEFNSGFGGTGLTVNGGSLQAVGCSFAGGTALTVTQYAPARLLAGCVFPFGFSPSITGNGHVRYDPTLSFPGTPFGPNVVATPLAMPALTSSYAAGTAAAQLAGAVGHLGVIAISLPGPVVAVPGITDRLWLDTANFIPVASGLVGAGAPLQAQLSWTPGVVQGVPALWQALTFDPAGALHLSNPSLVVLP